MISYKELAVGDPLAFVFQKHHLKWLSGIIAVSAVVAMASVLLVFQLGQPRIWMSMSRDGLLPAIFSRIHPKFHTPSFATIVTGFMVGVPALFMNLTMVTNLCSIGTLFAFVLVCAGVMKLQNDSTAPRGSFKTPYLNSKFIFGPLFIIGIVLIWNYKNDAFVDFIKSREIKSHSEILSALNDQEKQQLQVDLQKISKSEIDLQQLIIENIDNKEFKKMMRNASKVDDKIYTVNLANFSRNIPMWIFLLISFLMIFWSFTKNLSIIPLLGFESCLYMMAEIELENWIGFFIWLIAGLLIYFSYGYKNSKLNLTSSETKA
jgi:amino acid transporter